VARGLFAGIEISERAPAYVNEHFLTQALAARGVLTKETHGTVLRLTPPLIVTQNELAWGLARLDEVFTDAGQRLSRAA
jgi:ornithine--oxo-acid transaminase